MEIEDNKSEFKMGQEYFCPECNRNHTKGKIYKEHIKNKRCPALVCKDLIEFQLWDRVVRGRWGVLCPACFDEEAEAAGIRYTWNDVELWPVSWSDWVDKFVDYDPVCEPRGVQSDTPDCAALRKKLSEIEAERDRYRAMVCRLQAELTNARQSSRFRDLLTNRLGL